MSFSEGDFTQSNRRRKTAEHKNFGIPAGRMKSINPALQK
jgi:hypothetical protein